MRLSQSGLKDFEREDSCPLRWKAQWIDKEIDGPSPTDAMMYGHFFETLVIGSGAHGNEVTDLPRLKSGAKSIDQIRIERQADIARQYLDEESDLFLGFRVLDSQLVVSNDEKAGVIDILAEDETGQIVIIDLKLTADVSSTYGKFSWGNPSGMDFIQQVLYGELYKKEYGIDNARSILLVFDYSSKLGKKLIELDITQEAIDSCWSRFDAAEGLIGEYSEDYWPTFPSQKECEGCPLDCKDRHSDTIIEKLKIII